MARRVLVIGGGITGVTAALRLAERPDVDAVELWEATDSIGGKIRTSPFAGLGHIDEGADAYLVRVPHATRLAADLGLDGAALTAPTGATAMVWTGRRMHPIPPDILLGVPAAIAPLATMSLLTRRGKLRAGLEPLLPRRAGNPARFDSIGRLVRARFGDEVHDRLVDALVGSIYATDTDRTSLAAVPQLEELVGRHRSLLLAARRQRSRMPTRKAPIFAAPREGMGALVDAAAAAAGTAGVTIRTRTPAHEIASADRGWVVDDEPFDSVVVASPARQSAPLLADAAPDASRLLAGFEQAGVVIVRLAVAAADWPSTMVGRSGYLVPKSRQRLVTAVSFGSQKWSHWQPSDGSQILRVSLGRDGLGVDDLDDAQLIDRAVAEVGHHLGIDLQPTTIGISRWPRAFPQYRPGHRQRLAALDAALPPGLVLAGASYRGIGIPACIADAERAVAAVLTRRR